MVLSNNRLIVLVAEDDDDDRLLLRSAFEENRQVKDLRFVENGQELMDYLHQCNGGDPSLSYPCPDLVLLDLNMPVKDGREALQEIKSDQNLRHIPIVVLTTSGEEKDILNCYVAGANAYIIKPVSYDGLVHAIKLLGQYWFDLVTLPNENKF